MPPGLSNRFLLNHDPFVLADPAGGARIWPAAHPCWHLLKMKALARHWFGLKTDRWFRFIYNIIAIFTLLPILVFPYFLIDKKLYHIPYPWVIITLTIQLLAADRPSGWTEANWSHILHWTAPTTAPRRYLPTQAGDGRLLPLRSPSALHSRFGIYLAAPHHDMQPASAQYRSDCLYISLEHISRNVSSCWSSVKPMLNIAGKHPCSSQVYDYHHQH